MSDLKDWRDQPIEPGVMVIWRQGRTSYGTWKIGVVSDIKPANYGPGYTLDIEWSESSSSYRGSMKARGVEPYNVTVWPAKWGPPHLPNHEYKEVS